MEKKEELFEKLSELSESKEYQKDFNKVKQSICLKGKKDSRKFIRYHFPDDWDGNIKNVTWEIPLKRIRDILKNGNVNESFILIPPLYSSFRDKWDLEYFFDPTKGFHDDFRPFKRRDPVLPTFPPMSEEEFDALPGDRFNPYEIHVKIDLTFPIKIILRELKKEIKDWRDDLVLESKSTRGRPKSRYSNLRLIREIWEKTCKGKELSRNQQSKKIKESLGYTLNENTINKHYLSKLMARK